MSGALSVNTSVYSTQSFSASGSVFKAEVVKKMQLKRMFIGVCNEIIRQAKESFPAAVAADKEKMFDWVYKNGLEMDKWEKWIMKVIKDEDHEFLKSTKNAITSPKSVIRPTAKV